MKKSHQVPSFSISDQCRARQDASNALQHRDPPGVPAWDLLVIQVDCLTLDSPKSHTCMPQLSLRNKVCDDHRVLPAFCWNIEVAS